MPMTITTASPLDHTRDLDPDAVVRWPDPSPLQSGWDTVMRATRRADNDTERRKFACR
ncbi:Uncharacterised protein [Nocardia africana]|uniref:Uncharacterized protein n=1 Tax=Nocardia africana TaxID=134964 RepID=A0A378WXZ0_9NOCA|nr:Uncharacterised protein [Nocardia africana]